MAEGPVSVLGLGSKADPWILRPTPAPVRLAPPTSTPQRFVPSPQARNPRRGSSSQGPGKHPDRARRAGLSACCRAAQFPAQPRPHGWMGSSLDPARPAARSPESPLLATGPLSALTARWGPGPPLGSFRFRFPADIVEENESGRGQGWCSCSRGEGRRVRRRRVWSLESGTPGEARAGRGLESS